MISVIIPTFNAGRQLPGLLRALRGQSVSAEIVIVDSSSTDDTTAIAGEFGVEAVVIKREDFDHGGTRTLAGKKAHGDILVYLTQDAMPADRHAIGNLIAPFDEDKEVGGAYGRQLPCSGASAFAAHLRMFNYPQTSYSRTFGDRKIYGIKTAFLSDSFAAYRRSALETIGWFRENLISGEDTYAGAKLLSAGYGLRYVSDALVYHSHNYTVMEEFKRYFDTGVFHAGQYWILETFGKAEGEGMRYIRSELGHLISRRKYRLFFEFVCRNMMKYAGYRLGRNYRRLPARVSREISRNKGWWKKSAQTDRV